MACIHQTPETDVTLPTFLKVRPGLNGKLDPLWLRSFDGTTRLDYKLFVPVSYAMQAMHLAAAKDGIQLRTTGRNRTLAQQEKTFKERYEVVTHEVWLQTPPNRRRIYEGKYWRQKPGTAMAATPGTSNHGWACADDISEDDPNGPSIDENEICWLKANQTRFGFALDIQSEAWHRHWHNGDALTKDTVKELTAAGIKIPDLSFFGFTVPDSGGPPPVTAPAVSFANVRATTTLQWVPQPGAVHYHITFDYIYPDGSAHPGGEFVTAGTMWEFDHAGSDLLVRIAATDANGDGEATPVYCTKP